MKQNKNILIIAIGLLVIFAKQTYNRESIVSDKSFTYKVYIDSATYKQTPTFSFGDSYIRSTGLKWLCNRDEFESLWGYRTDNVTVFDGEKFTYELNYPVPKYHMSNRYFDVSNTPERCWEATLTFFDGDKEVEYVINPNDEIVLNKYLKIKMNPTGKVYYGTKRLTMHWLGNTEKEKYYFDGEYVYPWDWKIDYEFEILNKDFLNAKIDDNKLIVKLNSDKKVKVEIYNDFANNVKGGLSWYTNAELISEEHFGKERFNLNKGLNEYSLPISTNLLGYTFLKVQPYIFLEIPRSDEFYLYDDYVSEERFNVVTEVSEVLDTGKRCSSSGDCPSGMYCKQVEYLGVNYGACMKGEEPVDYPTDTTLEEDYLINDVEEKKDKTLLWIAGIVLVFIVLSIILKGKNGK